MRIISRVIPGAKKVDVREWVPPPCHCEKRSDEAIPHPASASTFPGGRLRRRFASRNDRYLAQLAAGESIIRAPGITALATRLAAHWQAARVRRVTTRELTTMSACELSDMGITRLDVSRLFEPRAMSEPWGPELRSCRGAGRVAAVETFTTPPQRSAVMTNLEPSA